MEMYVRNDLRPIQKPGHSELIECIARHTPTDGCHATQIPSLFLYRSSVPSEPIHSVYDPALCLVAQGSKIVTLGCEVFTYDADRFLLVSVGLPMAGRVVEATPDCPYLGLRLDLDPTLIAGLSVEAGVPPSSRSNARLGLSVGVLDSPLSDAVIRLISLLDQQQHIPVLAPLILREIVYLLLMGSEGARLREIALTSGQTQRVAKAIDLLRRHYDRPLRIETLAREIGMSASGLHHHFKSITALSPLQFQKQLRLQEARRLMLGEGMDAASACFRVGYESPSQFSREYRRLFGAPPGQDVARLRETAQMV